MRRSLAMMLGGLLVVITALGFAQPGMPPRTLPPEITNPAIGLPQPSTIVPVSGTRTEPAGAVRKASRIEQLDLNKLNDLQRQMVLSTQRATVWLARMHGKNGRFLPGWQPALKAEMEGDNFLHQAGAAFALARAARFSGESKLTSLATETLLSLLDETHLDEKSQIRFTPLPSVAINRLAAAGLLVAAINELPDPQADLLLKSEQLCAYIRNQARPEGWLCFTDTVPSQPPGDSVEMQTYPGMALLALQLSQRHKPAPWKTDILKRAVTFYLPWWRIARSPGFVPWQSAAYAEAFFATNDPAFATAVLEMNDWLGTLQYSKLDPRMAQRFGGFMAFHEGKTIEAAPTVQTAAYVESMVEACRIARHQGDLTRLNRYVETVERGLQFLTTLQYTEAGTQHFESWYRPRIVGGFHASHQDGNLRLDHTQQALTALVRYLDQVLLR